MNNFIKGGRVHAFFQELFCQTKTKSNPDAKKQGKSVETLQDSFVPVRRVPEDQSKTCQSGVEELPTQSGTKDEAASKTSLTTIEQECNKLHEIGRFNGLERLSRSFSWTCFIPTSNLLRTNFECPTLLHSSCTALLPQLARENSGATAVNLWSSCNETPKLVRIKCEESSNMVSILFITFQQIFTKTRNLSNCERICFTYHKNTRVTPRKDDKTTQLLPYECPRITPLNRVEILNLLLKNGGSPKRLSKWSNFLRRLSAYFEYDRLCRGFKNVFIKRVRDVKDGGCQAERRSRFFFKLIRITLILFVFQPSPSLLLAQVDSPFVKPNKKSLYIGDTVPKEFFTHQNRFVDMISQEKFDHSLKSYQDKLIILDFWASWCRPCLGSLLHLSEILPQLDTTKVVIVPVAYETVDKIQPIMDRFKWNHHTVYADTTLMQYFPKTGIPHMVWIKNGKVIAKPGARYATVENINQVLAGRMPKMKNTLNVKVADFYKPLFQHDNAHAEIVHREKYFRIGSYVADYAIDRSGITETKDSIFYAGINQNLDFMLYDIFQNKVSPFLRLYAGAIKYDLPEKEMIFIRQDTLQAKGLSMYAKDSLSDAWDRENLVSYDMRIPKAMGKEKGLSMLQNYWVSYLKSSKGWNVRLAYTKPMRYPIIKVKNSVEETMKLLSQQLPERKEGEYLQYPAEKDSGSKLSKLIGSLSKKTTGVSIDFKDAVNRTGLPDKFQYVFELPTAYYTKKVLEPNELKEFLNKYGLVLEVEQSPLLQLVIGK